MAVNPGPHLAWTTGALVAASANDASGWLEVAAHDSLRLSKTSTGGVYAFEIDWSRDGTTVDFVQAITVPEAGSTEVIIAAPYARLRVKNTDGAAAFTAHRTNAMLFAR